MRGGPSYAPGWGAYRSVWIIVGINFVVWLATASGGRHRPSELFLALAFDSDAVLRGQIWRLFTAFWVHSQGVAHLLFNMFLLWMFGRSVEAQLGRRRFWTLYLLAGLASTTVLLLLAVVTGERILAVGASGCVYGVLVFAACANPHATVLLFFVLPMPMWVAILVLMVGVEVLQVIQFRGAAVSAIGHLAGAGVGFLYFRKVRYGAPRASGRGPLGRLDDWFVRRKQKNRLQREIFEQRRARERVDDLLEKINKHGINSLTDEEKDFLEEASRRYE